MAGSESGLVEASIRSSRVPCRRRPVKCPGFTPARFLLLSCQSRRFPGMDASTHLLENPYAPHLVHGHQFAFTVVLLAAVFLRGFSEAIGIAVVLVGVYLALNAVVVGDALVHVATGSAYPTDWWSALTQEHSSALAVIGVALVAFPSWPWACPDSRPACW